MRNGGRKARQGKQQIIICCCCFGLMPPNAPYKGMLPRVAARQKLLPNLCALKGAAASAPLRWCDDRPDGLITPPHHQTTHFAEARRPGSACSREHDVAVETSSAAAAVPNAGYHAGYHTMRRRYCRYSYCRYSCAVGTAAPSVQLRRRYS